MSLPDVGTPVVTADRIRPTSECASFLVHERHLAARRPSAEGVYEGWVPGAGGDLWWVKHSDGTTAVYLDSEVKVVTAHLPALSDLETLKALLLRAGYAETAEVRKGDWKRRFAIREDAGSPFGVEFPHALDLGNGPEGIDGLACSFYFDADGKLLGHGAWQ